MNERKNYLKAPFPYVLEGDMGVGDAAGAGQVPGRPPRPEGPRQGVRDRPTLLGVSLADVVRWMGARKWDAGDAARAIEFYGGEATPRRTGSERARTRRRPCRGMWKKSWRRSCDRLKLLLITTIWV